MILFADDDTYETSKRKENVKTSADEKKKNNEKDKKRKQFVPFQYYATTGEADDEPSQLDSESTNSTWDQKMEEVNKILNILN